jgi:hypothetical protein
MTKRSRLRPAELFAALLLLGTLHLAAAAQTRIVAIGDVHGAFPEFEAILKQTSLLDAKRGASGGWTGGRTVLVQVGDAVDRGPKSRACLDLLMALEKSAERQKGKVIALLGNHEVMAMTGDFNYVSAEDYQSFATGQSEKIRQNAYRDYLSFIASRSDLAGVKPAQPISPEKWMAGHPLGFFERRDAFGPQGVYGRWLRQHNAAYQSEDVAFVHGGLSPNFSFKNIDDLNEQMHVALAAFDSGWQALTKAGIIWRYMTFDEAVLEIQRERAAIPERPTENTQLKESLALYVDLLTWLVSSNNPTWYRGLAEEPEAALGPGLDAMLARVKIGYIVAAHTVMPDFQIHQRFGNRVFLIDTGMLHSVFGGRASALEIQGGRFTAHSLGQPPQVLAPRTNAGGSPAAAGQANGTSRQ